MKTICYKLYLVVLLNCLFTVNYAFSKDLETWREQLGCIIKYHQSLSPNDKQEIILVNYAYKGKINTDEIKSEVLDSIFSSNAIFPLILPPIIETDTTYTDNERTIIRKSYPQFKLVTLRSLVDSVDSKVMGEVTQIRQLLEKNIQMGFEYVELEWDYKGKKIKSLCIVYEKGVVYDHISSRCWMTGAGVEKEITSM